MSSADRSRSSSRRRRSDEEASLAPGDDWTGETDPKKRRQLQNMLAQRRFRERQKERKEEQDREAENKRKATSSYMTPDARDLQGSNNLSGLPWGGISMRHIVESGKQKEQQQAQSSQDTSATTAESQAKGSSGLGLQLTDAFARGYPAWHYFLRPIPSFSQPYRNRGRRPGKSDSSNLRNVQQQGE